MLTEEVYTESDCSNDENLPVRFNISLLDLFSKKQVSNKEDSLYVAVSLSLFGNEMYTTDIREETRKYMKKASIFWIYTRRSYWLISTRNECRKNLE